MVSCGDDTHNTLMLISHWWFMISIFKSFEYVNRFYDSICSMQKLCVHFPYLISVSYLSKDDLAENENVI